MESAELNWWLLKWIVLPLVIIGGLVLLVDLEKGKWQCRRLAKEHGYIAWEYLSPTHVRFGEGCILTKKRNPDGTIDPQARLVIELR